MSVDPLEERLRSADESAPKLELRPPSLADLERRGRLQVARRAGPLLAAAVLAACAVWVSAVRESRRADLVDTSTESLASSLAELEDVLASLRKEREPVAPAASTASEEVAMATFRALHRSADRGDAESIEGLRWLARQFSTTQGGRCAQLFLSGE